MKPSNNQPYFFAVIGTGKLAKAFAIFFVFLLSKKQRKNVLFIGPQKTSNLDYFKKLGFSVSNDYQLVANVRSVVIAVAPGGIGDVLFALKYAQLQPDFDQYFVVIVSGVRKAPFTEEAGINRHKLIIATTDTNISSGNGLMVMNGEGTSPYFQRAQEEMKMFGTVQATSPTKVRKSITFVGSWAAFNAKDLWVSYITSGVTCSFTDWLFELYERYDEIINAKKIIPEYAGVQQYIRAMVPVLKRFGYRNHDRTRTAFNHITKILFNTVLTFLAEGVTDEEGVRLYIERVASKDGCTERGIGKINTPADFASPTLLTTTGLTINQVVKDVFPVRVSESIEEARKKDGGHIVHKELARGNYPLT